MRRASASIPCLLMFPTPAEALVAALVQQWQKPIDTLSKAGRAFDVRGVFFEVVILASATYARTHAR